ncbi:MAG: hypothetical protein WCE83_10905 [Candidatus Baltobacteraceae bacterium]|jgi:outer membrane lipoprotein-sorting protein
MKNAFAPRTPLPSRVSRVPAYRLAPILACAALFWLGALPASAQAQPPAGGFAPPIAPLLPTPQAKPPAWLAFEHAWANITAYSTTVTTFEQEGTRTQTWVFDYTFRKPTSATVHYNKGPNAGVTAVWNGGNAVSVHRSGLLAVFKKTFALHDPTVTTIRGSSIDQLSFAAIISHAQDTPGTVSEGPGPTILGIPTESVALIPNSAVADTGLTHEVVDISTMTSLPLRVLGFDGETLVRQVDFADIKLEH